MTLELGIGTRNAATLRMALSLAAASGRAFRHSGQRKPAPLFAEVDIAVARALAEVFGGELTLDDEGGVSFEPGTTAKSDETAVRVTLAGDVPLVPLVLSATAALAARRDGAEIAVTYEGSTHAPDGASFEVAASCFVPLLERMGIEAKLELDSAGFAPRGGGIIKTVVTSRGGGLEALSLGTKEPLRSIGIFSGAPAAIPVHVQQRQAARARSGVAVAGVETNVQLVKLKSRKAGSVVAITGLFGDLPITVSAVSRRGGSVESVGVEAASEFRRAVATPSVLPPILVEPLVVALAFAPGRSVLSTWRLPPDVETLGTLVAALAGREVQVEGKAGKPGNIVIEVADPPRGTSY